MSRLFALKCFFLVTLLALLSKTILAAHDAGTEPALYLGAGAKAISLGRAGVTDSTSAFSLDWNPASLGLLPRWGISLQHAALFAGAWHDTLAIAYPTLDWGTWALQITRLELGGIERRGVTNLPAGDFAFLQQEALLGYGYPLFDFLSLGVGIKLHHLYLDGLDSKAPGANLGLLWRWLRPFSSSTPANTSWLQSVSVGLACRNAVGPRLRLGQEYEQLYPNWRLGTSIILAIFPEVQDQLEFRAEAEKAEFADFRWHAGLEYALYQCVALRGGWDHEYFSAGAGFQYAGMTLDYAVSFPALGMRHLVTFSVALGQDMGTLRSNREAEAERNRQAIVENLKKKIIIDYQKQAEDLTQQKKYPEAIKLWEKILDWDPENMAAQSQVTTLRQALTQAEIATALKRANQYLNEQRYIDVLVECRDILDRDPQHLEAKALYERAEKKAARLGSTSLVANVQMIETMRQDYQLGLRAYTERDWQAAVQHWEKVIENTPLQKQVYHYLQQARERLTQAQQQQVKTAGGSEKEQQHQKLYKEAVDLSRTGKLKEAVGTWEKLLKENPEDQDAQRNLDKTRQDFINSQKKGIRW